MAPNGGTTLRVELALCTLTDTGGRTTANYGSEGWGFESLRARCEHRGQSTFFGSASSVDALDGQRTGCGLTAS
jgi:hypothetical protein